MTRNEIEAEYKVNEAGVITDLGKFQGEPLYAVYLWEAVLDSSSDFSVEDGDTTLDIFEIKSEDIAEWPELIGVVGVAIWEDENGFVHTKELSALELSKLEAEA